MDFSKFKPWKLLKFYTKPIIACIIILLALREILSLSSFQTPTTFLPKHKLGNCIRLDKFMEAAPAICSYGALNNQKIALARVLLTARFLNRTLLMPKFSPLIIFNEVDLQETIAFDKIFDFNKFNSLCDGFVRLGRYTDLVDKTEPFKMRKGRGKMWSKERDLDQLRTYRNNRTIDEFEVIKITGKQAFRWHDQWPIEDYAKVFECITLANEIENDVAKVLSKIKEAVTSTRNSTNTESGFSPSVKYIAVHMRIEKDWMVHCKNWQNSSNITNICSSKEEIIEMVSRIRSISSPAVVYVAIADTLLDDDSILSGWGPGFIPYDKKSLGVWDIYEKYPYIVRSAIDFEVCLRSTVFLGNTFSTFSGLLVLSRTYKLFQLGIKSLCGGFVVPFSSYAYNVFGDAGVGPKPWMTNMSAPSLESISYGSVEVSCNGQSTLKN